MRNSLKHVVLNSGGGGVSYLLRDDFTDTVAAGSVDGTAATPGPGTRDVVDTGSNLSVSGGNAVFSTGTGSLGDPRITYGTLTRLAGRVIVFGASNVSPAMYVGYDAQGVGIVPFGGGIGLVGSILTAYIGGPEILIGSLPAGAFTGAVALGTSGFQVFIDNELRYVSGYSAAGLYTPGIFGNVVPGEFDFFRIPDALFLAAPLASDGAFGATTDGQGHADASGVGAGGSGLAWTDNKGAWSGASATALSGGEAIRTVDAGNADVLADLDITRTGGNASLVLRYTDDSNYLRLGTDGTSAILVEKVGGSENTLSTTAITYGAENTMRIRLEGQAARIYYNDAFVAAESSINAALTGTRVGLHTTDTGNSFDNLVAYASTGYTELNQW